MSKHIKKQNFSSSPSQLTRSTELIQPTEPLPSSSTFSINETTSTTTDSNHTGSLASYLEKNYGSSIQHQNFIKQSITYSLPQTTHVDQFLGCSPIEDYELADKLGEGTFGEVHKGVHKKTKKIVALKRILMHNEKEGIPLTAIREIKILHQLSHPNIVTLSDMAISYNHEVQGTSPIYMVFPYMDHDLAGLIENKSVIFSVPQIKCYMKQLLEGTLYLHQQNIIHRDLKAANLLIDNTGILKIADFGLSRPVKNKALTACVVTRWYRAPEILLGERHYTTAIDIWAIGCVFGEMLKRCPILMGNSDINQLLEICKLCGTPSEEVWPKWKKLPVASSFTLREYPRIIFNEFEPKHGAISADLLDKLLVLDPEKRLSAFEALNHKYFQTSPLPANPDDLPKYESSHEYNCRKERDRRKHHRNHGKNDNGRTPTNQTSRKHKYESNHDYNCRKEGDRNKHHRSHSKNNNDHTPTNQTYRKHKYESSHDYNCRKERDRSKHHRSHDKNNNDRTPTNQTSKKHKS
ncbi:16935_t:CDS:2 [Entrophospora sp. SA101]|nr:2859_t:CDS:2 [Entrophospora sp. SA101]CAJ0759179.1 16935_t:CDS:2 [Entrophospora sp. SA101]CAJ0841731.1 16161_t:CDS:2 [Entrophospora sp. SA101]CAJ0891404.1 12016_t:CDS:2 [Entrophospora sp. SA101]CAJ0895783.1 12878_t:CDS:2 [Entrophospora sp. SA101]